MRTNLSDRTWDFAAFPMPASKGRLAAEHRTFGKPASGGGNGNGGPVGDCRVWRSESKIAVGPRGEAISMSQPILAARDDFSYFQKADIFSGVCFIPQCLGGGTNWNDSCGKQKSDKLPVRSATTDERFPLVRHSPLSLRLSSNLVRLNRWR